MKLFFEKKKNAYEGMTVTKISMEGRESLLVGSVVTDKTIIVSTGQEIGAVYDFSAKSEIDGGSIYNQDWEAGTGSFPTN